MTNLPTSLILVRISVHNSTLYFTVNSSPPPHGYVLCQGYIPELSFSSFYTGCQPQLKSPVCYLTFSWRGMRSDIHTFPKSICVKVNAMNSTWITTLIAVFFFFNLHILIMRNSLVFGHAIMFHFFWTDLHTFLLILFFCL